VNFIGNRTGQKKARSTVSIAKDLKFELDVWNEFDLSNRILSIQCGKCGKMTKNAFIRRRKTPMGSLVIDVECSKCRTLKPNKN
jgi:hypothetical protein